MNSLEEVVTDVKNGKRIIGDVWLEAKDGIIYSCIFDGEKTNKTRVGEQVMDVDVDEDGPFITSENVWDKKS